MLGDTLAVGVHLQEIVEVQPNADGLAPEGIRHRVAIPPDIDETIPGDLARFPVRRIETFRPQRLQMRHFASKTRGHDFVDRGLPPLVRFVAEPLLDQLLQMRPALKGPIPDEEMVLEIVHHPLVLPLGPSPIRSTGKVDPIV